jgi:hypothetical protein
MPKFCGLVRTFYVPTYAGQVVQDGITRGDGESDTERRRLCKQILWHFRLAGEKLSGVMEPKRFRLLFEL